MVSSSTSSATPHSIRTSADLTPFSTPESSSSRATTPSTVIRRRSCARSWATSDSQIGTPWMICLWAIDKRCKTCCWRRRMGLWKILGTLLLRKTSRGYQMEASEVPRLASTHKRSKRGMPTVYEVCHQSVSSQVQYPGVQGVQWASASRFDVTGDGFVGRL